MVSFALQQNAFRHWLGAGRVSQLIKIINILLIVWLAWQLAKLTWLVFPESQKAGQPVTAPLPAPVQRAQQPRVDERQLASWHLFGTASEEEPVKKASPVDAPETRLNLTLRGVLASDDPGGARAIVADPRGQEESYALGDPLPGGAKLTEIYPDRIILERSGRFETLRLPKDDDLSGGAARTTVSHRSATRLNSSRPSGNRAAAFDRYRDEIKRNPASFLKYVQAQPATEAGKFVGFSLQPGPQDGAMQELGLEPGDIVTAINGIDIDSPAKGMKAMQALGEGDTVSVNLLRGGQEMSLSLTLPSSE